MVVIKKFWMENGNISDGETFVGDKCLKEGHRKFDVPGEMLFYKKALSNIIIHLSNVAKF